jgi:hypothetical protein
MRLARNPTPQKPEPWVIFNHLSIGCWVEEIFFLRSEEHDVIEYGLRFARKSPGLKERPEKVFMQLPA